MTIDTFHYYSRREHQERACAARSTDPAVAAIHGAMADHYAELMKAMNEIKPIPVGGASRS